MWRVTFVAGALGALVAAASAASAQTDVRCYTPAQLAAGARYGASSMTVPRNGRCSYSSTLTGMRVETPPRNGRVEGEGSGLTYIPNPGFTGSDTYVVTGTGGGRGRSSASGTVSITVSVTVQ